jgi:hypothetical protein
MITGAVVPDNALFSELVILHKCLLRMLSAIMLTAEL